MSTYRRYQDARDAAWRALLRFEVAALPVDTLSLLRRIGVPVLPFPAPQDAPRLAALLNRAGGGVCRSLRIRGQWQVFLYNGNLDESQARFALAHELGHLLLHHETRALAPGVRAFCGWENGGDLLEEPQSPEDYAADIFALRLLAPACVLHALGADTPEKIHALCGLPRRAAVQRAERMELLTRRDAFFTHPLEKQVNDRFRPFVLGRSFPAPGAACASLPAAPSGGDSTARETPPAPSAPLTEKTVVLPPSYAEENGTSTPGVRPSRFLAAFRTWGDRLRQWLKRHWPFRKSD